MIANTTKNGVSVQLSADFHIDIERVDYKVTCKGYTFLFYDFPQASRLYKCLSRDIEAGNDVSYQLAQISKMGHIFNFDLVRRAK